MDSPRRTTHPSHAASSVINLFRLPRIVRDTIYRRVLAVRHPIYLFQETVSSVVEAFAPGKPRRWLALLHTNRTIYDEAKIILYGLNHFSFIDTVQNQGGLIHSFLERIGPANAGYLSHITINFPALERHGGEFTFGDDDLRSLQLLREHCTGLKTLEMRLYGQNATALHKASQDAASAQRIREMLVQIDARRKAISSFCSFVIRGYGGPLVPELEEAERRLGWVALLGD